MKKILVFVFCFLVWLFSSFAVASDARTIIPWWWGDWTRPWENAEWEKDRVNSTERVWKEPWKVWENYNKESKKWSSNSSFAFKTWIFSWDAVFHFMKHLANFLSQMWLLIWAAMIIYAWYKYAIWVFTWDASKWWRDALKWAIYGVLILIFSYAFMRMLLNMFW